VLQTGTTPKEDRFGRVVDAQGNGWAIATHIEDVPAKDMRKRAAAVFAGAGGKQG
jgi:hypothetical protein